MRDEGLVCRVQGLYLVKLHHVPGIKKGRVGQHNVLMTVRRPVPLPVCGVEIWRLRSMRWGFEG
jgi:hypothetical protein